MAYTTTQTNYRDDVKRELSLDTGPDNLEWSDAYINQAVNYARQKFWNQAGYHSKPGMVPVALVINVGSVTIPDGVDDIKYLRFNDGSQKFKVDPMSLDSFLRLDRVTTTGRPYKYARNGKDLLLWPTPNQSLAAGLEIYGNLSLTELSDSNATDLQIEARWKPHIIEYAVGRCWEKAEQLQLANARYGKYEKMFLENSYDIKSGQTEVVINPWGGEDWIDETDPRILNKLT